MATVATTKRAVAATKRTAVVSKYPALGRPAEPITPTPSLPTVATYTTTLARPPTEITAPPTSCRPVAIGFCLYTGRQRQRVEH